MKRCLIVYFSQGSTTAKVTEHIARGLAGAGYDVISHNLLDGPPPALAGYDLLGIGSPVHYYRLPFNVADYMKGLPDLAGLPVFAFLLHATYHLDAGNALRRELARKGGREVGFAYFLGAGYFLGYLRRGSRFCVEHPTAAELTQAEAFGREIAERADGAAYVPPAFDAPAPAIYAFERMVTARPLVKNVYSRLFRVDGKKCKRCGKCIKLCPTHNIAAGPDKFPVHGSDCMLCLMCEAKCPEDAIRSPLDWIIFTPFLDYNIHQAARDPALSHTRVIFQRGRATPR